MGSKRLQVLDMDAVLPVAHLQSEEARAAVYGVWPIIQRCKWRVVAIAAGQNAFCHAQCIWMVSGGALPAAVLCWVLGGDAWSRMMQKDSRACSRSRSGLRMSRRFAGRFSSAL